MLSIHPSGERTTVARNKWQPFSSRRWPGFRIGFVFSKRNWGPFSTWRPHTPNGFAVWISYEWKSSVPKATPITFSKKVSPARQRWEASVVARFRFWKLHFHCQAERLPHACSGLLYLSRGDASHDLKKEAPSFCENRPPSKGRCIPLLQQIKCGKQKKIKKS